jgi:hypothetical protein
MMDFDFFGTWGTPSCVPAVEDTSEDAMVPVESPSAADMPLACLPPVLEPQRLSTAEITGYKEALQSQPELFRLVSDTYTMDYQTYNLVTQSELQQMISFNSNRGEYNLSQMLGKLAGLSAGDVTFVAAPGEVSPGPAECYSQSTYVVYAQRIGDKYNIIVAKGAQAKVIHKDKVAACYGGSLVGGGTMIAICGALHAPIALSYGLGILLGGCLGRATNNKLLYDFNQPMQNATVGYILMMLQRQGAIDTSGGCLQLR